MKPGHSAVCSLGSAGPGHKHTGAGIGCFFPGVIFRVKAGLGGHFFFLIIYFLLLSVLSLSLSSPPLSLPTSLCCLPSHLYTPAWWLRYKKRRNSSYAPLSECRYWRFSLGPGEREKKKKKRKKGRRKKKVCDVRRLGTHCYNYDLRLSIFLTLNSRFLHLRYCFPLSPL